MEKLADARVLRRKKSAQNQTESNCNTINIENIKELIHSLKKRIAILKTRSNKISKKTFVGKERIKAIHAEIKASEARLKEVLNEVLGFKEQNMIMSD